MITGSRFLVAVNVLPLVYGPLTQVLATLAALSEESLAQASAQTLSQPFSGWMTKSALPV